MTCFPFRTGASAHGRITKREEQVKVIFQKEGRTTAGLLNRDVIYDRILSQTEVKTMAEFHRGVLKTWKDDRGFGFIQPDHGDKDIFIHISALRGVARRPVRGDVLFYQVGQDAGGKFKAINARIDGAELVKPQGKVGKKWLWLTAAALGLVSAAVAAYAYLY